MLRSKQAKIKETGCKKFPLWCTFEPFIGLDARGIYVFEWSGSHDEMLMHAVDLYGSRFLELLQKPTDNHRLGKTLWSHILKITLKLNNDAIGKSNFFVPGEWFINDRSQSNLIITWIFQSIKTPATERLNFSPLRMFSLHRVFESLPKAFMNT